MTGVWNPEYGRAYRERKRLGLRSTYHNALTWEERFWPQVERAGLFDCWIWTGRVNANGYGHVNVPHGSKSAHRVAYERLVGPVPEGLELDHLCRNRRCVNPAHLEPVTHQENCRRKARAA